MVVLRVISLAVYLATVDSERSTRVAYNLKAQAQEAVVETTTAGSQIVALASEITKATRADPCAFAESYGTAVQAKKSLWSSSTAKPFFEEVQKDLESIGVSCQEKEKKKVILENISERVDELKDESAVSVTDCSMIVKADSVKKATTCLASAEAQVKTAEGVVASKLAIVDEKASESPEILKPKKKGSSKKEEEVAKKEEEVAEAQCSRRQNAIDKGFAEDFCNHCKSKAEWGEQCGVTNGEGDDSDGEKNGQCWMYCEPNSNFASKEEEIEEESTDADAEVWCQSAVHWTSKAGNWLSGISLGFSSSYEKKQEANKRQWIISNFTKACETWHNAQKELKKKEAQRNQVEMVKEEKEIELSCLTVTKAQHAGLEGCEKITVTLPDAQEEFDNQKTLITSQSHDAVTTATEKLTTLKAELLEEEPAIDQHE